MNIIITMAGEGRRFREVGYECSKHEIVVGGKTLFEWSLNSLSSLFDNTFYFIVRQGFYDEHNLKDLISKIGIKNFCIIEINELTDGQATSAYFANKYIKPNESVLIYNIDTYVEDGFINKNDFQNLDGLIHVFDAPGDKWSFARVNEKNQVVEVSEKVRISNNASIGLYYFKEWNMFTKTIEEHKDSIKQKYKEAYIAPMYEYLLRENNIQILEVPFDKVHILGTPEDLDRFKIVVDDKRTPGSN